MPLRPPTRPYSLRDFLIHRSIDPTELARRAGVPPASITTACRNEAIASIHRQRLNHVLIAQYGSGLTISDLFCTDSD